VIEKGLEERGSWVFIHSCKTLYLCEKQRAWSHRAARVHFSILEVFEKELTAPWVGVQSNFGDTVSRKGG
jgi:hypothetical protein